MKRILLLACTAVALVLCHGRAPTHGQSAATRPDDSPRKFEDFDKLVKGARLHEGLFHLHHKDEHVYAEIQRQQLDRPLLCPIAIARGLGMGGHTLNFDEQWVLVFRRVGDRIHLVRRNVHFQAKKDSPLARAVETTYTDSILLALKIQALNPKRDSVVIDLNDIFMSDFAQLDLGGFDPSRSTWHKVKAFPRNIELEVAATYNGRGTRRDGSVIDSRGTTVVVHYGLVELPDGGYQPRLADDRVGYFLSVVKDFSSESKDTSFLRYVNRWRLERADNDPKNLGKLSPPRKKIVFWIEKSVPDEYRSYVREGILEWNKAFEKIGFRDAIEVRQQENEEFDPEDINYNTVRWITNGRGYAMGPSRTNPLTGEILDADIIFDADMIRYWKQESRSLGSGGGREAEPASLIQATRLGWGLADVGDFLRQGPGGWNDRPARGAGPALDPRTRLWALRQGLCQCGPCKKYELGLAAMAIHARGLLEPGAKVPEDLIGQAIKETMMHEVGHTLGLRHNFKASTMLAPNQLHDTSITRKQGLSGSVMDYNPVNLAPKGVKQGDYFSTTIGPYDYWAIEYAYKPLSGGTEGEYAELQKIAARGAAPGHDYGTDEDLYGTADPLINVWDLGSDPMKFAQDRMVLAEELLEGLADRVVDKGEGYQRARLAFNVLLGQYGNGAHLVANYVGGEHINRDHRGDPHARDPFVPVKPARQREALKFLQEHILTDKPFHFAPQQLRRLAADRWWHWGHESAAFNVDYGLHERILRIQKIVLDHMFNPAVLARIQNNSLKTEQEEQPLTLAEVFRSLSEGIWSELPVAAPRGEEKRSLSSSIVRRNLQRAHVQDLTRLVLGPRDSEPVPPDARSLARLHLREIQRRIETNLKDKHATLDDTTRAHLEECHERIVRVLNAGIQVNEP